MAGRLRFGGFELDLAGYALRAPTGPLRLEKLPMEVLILLVQRAGALVQRSEIQATLWGPDVHVEHDASINTAVRKLRRALGDEADTPRFIETVVGKGYRFIAPIDADGSAPARHAPGAYPTYSVTRGVRTFVLDAGDTVLGRDPDAGVRVDHPSVSRRHACLSIGAGGAVLRDLRSRNGTFVDGRRIDAPTRLDHGSIIGLGPITLTFVVMAAPASTRPVGPPLLAE